jgi:ABC-2 type transport system ATP-binding protein
MPPAIHTEQLTKDFIAGFWRTERRRALDGLTLEIGPGEVFGFLGANGAGKTTTLKLLLQLIFPTSGIARVLGRPAGDLSVRRRIGFLPEEPSFYDALTPEELLVYFGSLFGYAAAERRLRATRCLDAVGVGAERRIALRRLSKGTVQRVGIAQAIVNDPEVVFLDEPMSALDPLGRRDVRALILQLRDRGCTVFFSSHILPDAEAVCSRVGILANGRLLTAGRLSEILADDVRGWELVVDGVTANALTPFAARATRVTRITDERHALHLPATAAPEQVVAELAGAGVRVLSLTPVHPTLEEYFVERVTSQLAERGS